MKTLLRLAALSVLVFGLHTQARAQSYVVESPVTLTSTVLTQGGDTIKQTAFGVTLTTKNIKPQAFTNRDVLAAMLERGLIATSTTGWSLFYLNNEAGVGGIYARKTGLPPVAVPGDLLSLPTFGPALKGGTEVTTSFGVNAVGTNVIALASCQVNGIPVSGLANNATQTVAINPDSKKVEAVITTFTFNGGIDTPATRLIKGVLAIGKGKLSGLKALPPQ